MTRLRHFGIPKTVRRGKLRHNLPEYIPPLIGREQELDDLDNLLKDPTIRLITVLGPGGIGKTHLALTWAKTQLQDYEDGIFFIPLAHISTGDDIIPTFAEALNFSFIDEEEPAAQLTSYFIDKQMLLVVDNCEHLLEDQKAPGIPRLVGEIILAAPGIKILGTSREKLKLLEETLFHLDGLQIPPESDLDHFNKVLEYSAIKLFLQGARQVRPRYNMAGEDPLYITRICESVGGMPLGILLAAAWVEIFSPQQIYLEVKRNLDFLASDLRSLPDRHQSMRAVFDSAWKQLGEALRVVFINLSVFQGGFNREAAKSVAEADLSMLVDFVNKSLLYHDPTSGRYQIHELLRQYAEGKLEHRNKAFQAHRAHCDYFANFMYLRAPDLRGQRRNKAIQEIENDYDNIRSAWRWGLKRGDIRAIEMMLDSLEMFSYMRDRFYEGEELLREARDRFEPPIGSEPHPSWANILFAWNSLNFLSRGRLKDYSRITNQANRCLEAAHQRGEGHEIAICLYLLGIIAHQQQEYLTAIHYYQDSITSDPRIRDDYSIEADIGTCYRALGQLDQAMACYQVVLESARASGDGIKAGWALTSIGEIAMITGDLNKAKQSWGEAHYLLSEDDDLVGIMWNLTNLSLMEYFEGKLTKSIHLAEEALHIAVDVHHTYGIREAQVMLGHAAVAKGDYPKGQAHLQSALEIDPVTLDAHLGMSFAASGLGEYIAARSSMGKALDFYAALGVPAMISLYFPAAALILANEGESEQATEILSFIFTYAGGPLGLLEKWDLINQLQSNLKAELGSRRYQAAWDSGTEFGLSDALDVLIERFGKPTMVEEFQDKTLPSQKAQPLGEPLSKRELEILAMLKSELSGPEIADELMISINTYRYHTKNIYRKLDVNTRRAALNRADELGL